MTKIICDRCKQDTSQGLGSLYQCTIPVADLTCPEFLFRWQDKQLDLCFGCFERLAVSIAHVLDTAK